MGGGGPMANDNRRTREFPGGSFAMHWERLPPALPPPPPRLLGFGKAFDAGPASDRLPHRRASEAVAAPGRGPDVDGELAPPSSSDASQLSTEAELRRRERRSASSCAAALTLALGLTL